MCQNREEYEQGLQELNDYLSRVLAADAVDSDRSLLFFIRRRLFQYHLEGHLTIEDVLHEAVLRTQQAIQTGTVIQCIPAWMNKVCFHIICERSRESQSKQKLDRQLELELDVGMGLEPIFEYSMEKIGSLVASWETLKEPEQQILVLRHVEKYSWKEIANRLSDLEGKNISEPTVRKRGERALTRLRASFRRAILYADAELKEQDRQSFSDRLRSRLDE
jgi:RNA polymerase sigma factor (sigma-70 family)